MKNKMLFIIIGIIIIMTAIMVLVAKEKEDAKIEQTNSVSEKVKLTNFSYILDTDFNEYIVYNDKDIEIARFKTLEEVEAFDIVGIEYDPYYMDDFGGENSFEMDLPE